MSCSHVDVRVAEKILRLRIELVRLRRENKALRCFCKLENGQKMEFCGVDIDEAMHRVLMYPSIEFQLQQTRAMLEKIPDPYKARREREDIEVELSQSLANEFVEMLIKWLGKADKAMGGNDNG